MARAHLAVKTFFTKMDCSSAYVCKQMADNLIVQLLAIGGRKIAVE